jgi:hypothetical protein
MRKPPKNVQEELPGYREYRKEQELALEAQHKRLMDLWQGGLTQDKLFTARMLILCGFPIRERKSETMEPLVRRAQLGDRSWIHVSYIQTNKHVPLPYGADRTMAYFLTNKAVIQQSPILEWKYANEYMRLCGMDSNSGKNYKVVQERFTRLAYMTITVDMLDPNGKQVDNYKCPMIDHSRIAADIDGEGNWKPSTSVAKMLEVDQKIQFGLRFFAELQQNAVPIPIELIKAADKQWRVMDYAIFLYWRAWAGRSPSFIPWRYLRDQFDNNDSNLNRWPEQFKRAYRMMKALPDPINQIRADISAAGITVYPLPDGTTFFEGHPKLPFKRELAAPDSEEK